MAQAAWSERDSSLQETIELTQGRLPRQSNSSSAVRASETARRKASSFERTKSRLYLESSSNRTRSTRRRPAASGRAGARGPVGREVAVSASTPDRQLGPWITASQARRRAGRETGPLSAAAATDGPRSKAPRRAACAASRIGWPLGYTRTDRSHPMAAAISAACSDRHGPGQPSLDPAVLAGERPTARATPHRSSPRSMRPAREIAQHVEMSSRARAAPTSERRSRVPMARATTPVASRRSPAAYSRASPRGSIPAWT